MCFAHVKKTLCDNDATCAKVYMLLLRAVCARFHPLLRGGVASCADNQKCIYFEFVQQQQV